MRLLRLFARGAGLAPLLVPAVASAHAFGQTYTLPLPFSLYAYGASAALVASFIALLFLSKPRSTPAPSPRVVAHVPGWLALALRSLGFFAFALALAAGYAGAQEATKNLAPEFFWVFLLLGVTYLSVLVGNIWRLLNPIEPLVRLALGKGYRPFAAYPRRFGYWPALVVYMGLIKLELLSYGLGAVPSVLATVLIAYLVFSFLGAAIYGADAWFAHADFLNVFFEFLSKFAPLWVGEHLRLEFSTSSYHLVEDIPSHLSAVVFVMFMLSSTAFDGLKETQVWQDTLYPVPFVLANYVLVEHLILIAAPFAFFGFYALVVYLMKVLTRSAHSLRHLLLRFSFSLIPIAIAYSFAHYFTLLVNGVQSTIALISDPFGYGWNLFGTADYQVNIALIGAKATWDIQLVAIILGHIIATYIAHRIAVREFKTVREVMVGQIPMLLLMIFYTVFGLWILSLAFAKP